ncbi:hypothetical protein [Granulicella tundricola]|uniref:Lipoprotein n=1 Tax=Granulicella tundricola (strain ATCC BAA-1859 / DSM 23138 / MP5ACTX9) TaxID=1198114 RepID=E8WXU4_GRATM|nr:hypothetical protein [Granulicella tundricola]ADW69789.1 hypothetical protein AciX9_2765 [Granulicella tundricola MP5ACTX9]
MRLTFALIPLAFLAGCTKPAPTPAPAQEATETYHYPPRPTVPAPPIKLFHQDEDTLTLTTIPNATDDQVAAILWQLHDTFRAHTFAALHLPQTFIDARHPKIWFHIYRGPKCANEKFTHGKYPCGAKYNGAGDYTLGSLNNPNYEEAALRHADGSETALWNPEAPPKP